MPGSKIAPPVTVSILCLPLPSLVIQLAGIRVLFFGNESDYETVHIDLICATLSGFAARFEYDSFRPS
jgi:hypothetical protein